MNNLHKAVNDIEAILFQSMPFSDLSIRLANHPTSSKFSHLKTLLDSVSTDTTPEFSDDMDIHCFTAFDDGTVELDAVFGTLEGEDVALQIFGRFSGEEKDLILEIDEVLYQEKVLFTAPSLSCSKFWDDQDAGFIVHADPLDRFDIHVETEPRRKCVV